MSNTPKTRREQRQHKAQERVRQLRYLDEVGAGAWKLDDRERVELDSLIHRMERAQRAQQAHAQRHDVQLALVEAA